MGILLFCYFATDAGENDRTGSFHSNNTRIINHKKVSVGKVIFHISHWENHL